MTKIDIFSGFLGAGKTTLIKKLIKEAYTGEQLVLIENEFGEIGIDGGFMQEAGIKITEMSQGCICCSLVGDFGKALEKMEALTELEKALPQLDCGACGAPTCRSFAEDVVRGYAEAGDCIMKGRRKGAEAAEPCSGESCSRPE